MVIYTVSYPPRLVPASIALPGIEDAKALAAEAAVNNATGVWAKAATSAPSAPVVSLINSSSRDNATLTAPAAPAASAASLLSSVDRAAAAPAAVTDALVPGLGPQPAGAHAVVSAAPGLASVVGRRLLSPAAEDALGKDAEADNMVRAAHTHLTRTAFFSPACLILLFVRALLSARGGGVRGTSALL
jgi:hypothetical protein